VREWMTFVGPLLLSLIGVVLYSIGSDFPTAGALTLALPLILVSLVWEALALRRQLASPQDARGRGGCHDDG
jgi:predicted branched-subunit amino acid permease